MANERSTDAGGISLIPTGPALATKDKSGPEMHARFAHSLTPINSYLVAMFGGAVGDPGKYNISSDVILYDATKNSWRAIQVENGPPPRAAHAACSVNNTKLVIFGGATGGGSLSPPDVHVLDLKDPAHPVWQVLPITGPGPGCRYGHLMAYSKPNLIVFGGNNGISAMNDVWRLDIESPQMKWQQVRFQDGDNQPAPRVYCSGDVVREGGASSMVVIHGGRTLDGITLDDLWGLRQHRNKRWDWVQGPQKNRSDDPSMDQKLGLGRFQHTCIAIGTKLLIVGGRSSLPNKLLPTVSYDTESCTWTDFEFSADRYRHAACPFPTGDAHGFSAKVLMHGGFQQTSVHPTSQLDLIDAFDPHTGGIVLSAGNVPIVNAPGTSTVSAIRNPKASSRKNLTHTPNVDEMNQSHGAAGPSIPLAANLARSQPERRAHSHTVTLSSHVHTTIDAPSQRDHSGNAKYDTLPQRVALNQLGDESRRLRGYPISNGDTNNACQHAAIDSMISRLLKPNMIPSKLERSFNPSMGFILSGEEISLLTKKVIEILRNEPMVLRLRAPIKVYGDIHGQYYDLLRMFKAYKSPVMDDCVQNEKAGIDNTIEGDLDSTDYLFLGDYVDRGTNSLEVICLLFALKVRHPTRIHLLRGNHEDAIINSIYGFKDECTARLNENPDHPESSWSRINRAFEYLPMGALIEEKILCIHGGIGGTVNTIKEIEVLQRPLTVTQIPHDLNDQRVTDLLWSDPSENDTALGVVPNDIRDPDGSGHIVKFGPDRVVQFLQDNHLEMIIRAHECVMDGIERFAGGRLITLFSATDYCGTHKNAGALLFVRRDLTIVPKIIYPAGRDSPHNQMQPPGSTWILDPLRPPTPPRNVRLRREIFN